MHRIALLASVMLTLVPAWARPADRAAPGLRLSLESPESGAVVGASDRDLFVSGRALPRSARTGNFDVIIVIDTSYSTSAPSGADVDRDGRTGKRLGQTYLGPLAWLLPLGNTDADDSILAAEVAAARTLLAQLDPGTTRVGVVAFSGDARARTRDAWTEVPLTNEYARVNHGLDRILADGPHGRTNMYDAVVVALREVGGFDDAVSRFRDDSEKIILFMTDGRPTLPVSRAPLENARLAIEAARRAAIFGARIDTFAIGRGATRHPRVAVSMAAVTNGVFTPVEDPADLVAVFQGIRLSAISRVEVRNLTSGRRAEHVMVEADGHFSAVVPLQTGRNTLEIRAVSTEGVEGVRRISVRRLPRAPSQALSPRLRARRDRLLASRLVALRSRSLEMRLARDEQLRRGLETEMSAVRKRRRRTLEVSVEED